ncbi:unnamed protein product [Colias eurytheme]|nr:unnamed protein product [Colias eurytheme]
MNFVGLFGVSGVRYHKGGTARGRAPSALSTARAGYRRASDCSRQPPTGDVIRQLNAERRTGRPPRAYTRQVARKPTLAYTQ